jgi:uncharacterized protein (TIGR02271 family)
VAPDGSVLGEVEDLVVDTSRNKVRYLVVRPLGRDGSSGPGSMVFVDAITADLQPEARRVGAAAVLKASQLGMDGDRDFVDVEERGATRPEPTSAARSDEAARLTRSEEELRIGKRDVTRGEVRVGKRVETEHVREPVTRRREEAVIERRPVVSGERASATIEAGEIRVPLVEEEVVVEKRPVVKEELVIGKRVVEEREVVEADLKKERFEGTDEIDGTRNRRDR